MAVESEHRTTLPSIIHIRLLGVVSTRITPDFSHFTSRRLAFELLQYINPFVLRNQPTRWSVCRNPVALSTVHFRSLDT